MKSARPSPPFRRILCQMIVDAFPQNPPTRNPNYPENEGVFLQSGMCKFEWIFRQNKAENRRLTGGKSRFDNAVLAEKTPKLHIQDYRNTP